MTPEKCKGLSAFVLSILAGLLILFLLFGINRGIHAAKKPSASPCAAGCNIAAVRPDRGDFLLPRIL